jgi:cytochrome c553
MNQRLSLLAAMVLLAASAGAADVDAGRSKSLGCQACHGSNGIGTAPDIPNLAGQKPGYITAQLTAFRSKDRKHDLMNAMAAQLSDGDIENLAAFWSSLSAAGPAHEGADPAGEIRRSRMTFPASFPKEFVMYHEELGADQTPTKRAFVNRTALTAARAGKPLPSGSIILVENHNAEGQVSYAAMETRSGWGAGIPEILRNGDWSYALFDAQKQLRANFNYARCLACHKPQAPSSYVFALKEIATTK